MRTRRRKAFYFLKERLARAWYGPFRRPAELIGSYAKFGDWLRQNPSPHGFSERFRLYDHVQAETIGSSPIDYLEFGVFRGESIRYWAGLNQSAESRFYGFDTFEGLPETWSSHFGSTTKGAFNAGGQLPDINDPRVSFVKGLFQDTLPSFLESFEPRNRLVIHLDADLYSSTLYVLCSLDHLLHSGTVIIFDEFASLLHEFRALQDYAQAYRRQYRLLGYTTRCYEQVAIEME